MTADLRRCAACARVLDYIEMQDQHLEVLIACTSLDHNQMRARQRELAEIRLVMDGKALEAPWTMPHARARIYKEKNDG